MSKRIFNKLKLKHKVCLLDLDYRKKGLTRENEDEKVLKILKNFNEIKNNFFHENGKFFIPSFNIDSPA